MEMRINKCEWCGEPLPPPKGTGRPRRFCPGTTCRVASFRARQPIPTVEWEPAPVEPSSVPSEPVAAALLGQMASTDEQLYAAILNLSAVEIALRRLSVEARPEFAWRCQRLGEEIADARRRYFEGVLP